MNKPLLKSVMALRGDNTGDLAKYLGISRASVSSKMNEKVSPAGYKAEFKQSEIRKISDRYNLDAATIKDIFFS